MRTILMLVMMCGCSIGADEIDSPMIDAQANAPTGCTSAVECDDGNACTGDRCVWGQCRHEVIESCIPCSGPYDCDDGNACTHDNCYNGVCTFDPPQDHPLCGFEAYCWEGECCAGIWDLNIDQCVDNCDDGNACTVEIWLESQSCIHVPSECPGPCACSTDADCEDWNECTQSTCVNGTCFHAAVCNGCEAL